MTSQESVQTKENVEWKVTVVTWRGEREIRKGKARPMGKRPGH